MLAAAVLRRALGEMQVVVFCLANSYSNNVAMALSPDDLWKGRAPRRDLFTLSGLPYYRYLRKSDLVLRQLFVEPSSAQPHLRSMEADPAARKSHIPWTMISCLHHV
ncbi:hypothetical protein KC337_g116 [Hortaea werneckii]|nr:hypothetical protein KC337_g116 [Hortaea werneckii]